MAPHENQCNYHEDRPFPIRAYLMTEGKNVGPMYIALYAKPCAGDLLYEKESDITYEVVKVQLNSDNPAAALCIEVKPGAERLDP